MTNKKDIISKKSDTELFCKEAFQNFLESKLGNFDAEWERYPNGKNKPPDFKLTLGDKNYAVEMTETKILLKGQIEEKTFRLSRENFVKEVQREVHELGILRGLYCVFFLMPWTIQLNKYKKKIKKQLVKYIEDTKNNESAEEIDIKINYRIICQIFKMNNNLNKVFVSFADGAWPDSQENQEFVCGLLQYAICEKERLLKKESVPPPRILILYNSYPHATKKMYKNCLPNLNNKNYFNSIFIIMSPVNGFFLYACDEEWKRLFNVNYEYHI